MTKIESDKPKFEIISMDERIAEDPRGLTRLTRLSNGSFIVKKVSEAPLADPETSDPAVGLAQELLDHARKTGYGHTRELGEEI